MRSRNSLGRVNARAQLKLVDDLRAIRQDSGRTIDEVAAALRVESDVIVAFEQGESNFTMSTLRRYAKAVGLSSPCRPGFTASKKLNRPRCILPRPRVRPIFR
ncbi:helix-turn-helix domain-containing protein [Corynebacterium phoceense]|uniref:helix-turn-helix domain-containing protein n=1 Tax=Corynebacterium phoceense TaxID=1686286 RepID=UPI000981C0AD